MQPITMCLWFNGQAEEAARFYTSILPDSSVGAITHYTESSHRPKGSVLTVSFKLNGQDFMGLNGGPEFKFSESMSIVVRCDSQAELDRIWGALSADPKSEQCGWLKDKYGVSWQIIPAAMTKLLTDPDAAAVARVMDVVMKSKKLDLATLEAAHRGR